MPVDPLSRESVLDALSLLIRTPSVNPDIAPEQAHGEAAIAVAAKDWLAARGMHAWLEEAAPGRPNCVAEAGTGKGPTVVFCAHLDTVGTAGMTIPPFEPRVEGNRVYGRGSYDMKGSAAALMGAAAALHAKKFPGRILVSLVADEEFASIGAQDFVTRHKADACILTEPSEGKLILAHKGFVWAEITTHGRAAHGSRFDLGVSAIGKMGRIIAALERFDQEVLRRRTFPLLTPASQHCALIQGGSGLSTYSEKCTLQLERRYLPNESPEQILEELRQVIREAGGEADVTLKISRPALTCDRNSRIAAAIRDAAREVTGRAPEESGVAYWMDAAIFASAGIPTVNYGPAGAGAHEAVEWVDLDSVVTTARVLASSARRFLSSP